MENKIIYTAEENINYNKGYEEGFNDGIEHNKKAVKKILIEWWNSDNINISLLWKRLGL